MKSPVQVALGANGNSVWVPHDPWQTPFCLTLAGFVSAGASLTWAVQYTCDDIYAYRDISISQTTTVITVTDPGPPVQTSFGVAAATQGHGLSVNDWYKIEGSGLPNVDGEYAVATVPTATTLTLASAFSQSVAGAAKGSGARVFPHATLVAQTGRATGNYAFPAKASRLTVSGFASGVAFLEFLQGGMSS